MNGKKPIDSLNDVATGRPKGSARVVDAADGKKAVIKHTNFGGTEFLDSKHELEGDPKPLDQARRLLREVGDARRFEWQFRAAMAFRERPNEQAWWITLTYRDPEPADWMEAGRHVSLWVKRLRKNYYKTRSDKTAMQYLVVEEEGSINGRKHFHCLVWTPRYAHTEFRNNKAFWMQKAVKWPHGFIDVKRLDDRDTQGLAIYIAKYANKSNTGRTRCNSHFGLTTTTTLLTLSSFRLLTLSNPRLAQNLLRRLCLTPNYLSFPKLTSLISQHKLSTTSASRKALQKMQMIGKKTGLRQLQDMKVNALTSSVTARAHPFGPASFKVILSEIYAHFAGHVPGTTDRLLPGLQGFGSPFPLSRSPRLATDKATRVWFVRFNHPKCLRNRTRLAALRLQQSVRLASATASNKDRANAE